MNNKTNKNDRSNENNKTNKIDKSNENTKTNETKNINKVNKDNKKTKKILLIILSILLVSGVLYLAYYFYTEYKTSQQYNGLLNNIAVEESLITETKTKRMLQLEELKKENSDIVAWLEIEGTNINYPVLQAKDNDYYMDRDYKKAYSKYGSIFLDKDYDWSIPSSNLLMYGHNKNNNMMFGDLLKYSSEGFYKEHKNIKFTTLEEDAVYEILSVFYSRVYYQNERDVFRYYYFVNAENEQEYKEFVSNAKKASLYTTGVKAEYGDQLLTLSTCEYSQEDGRFVVVAKKRTTGDT